MDALTQWDKSQLLAAEQYGFGSDTDQVDWKGRPLNPAAEYLIYDDDIIDVDELYEYLTGNGAEPFNE